MKNVRREYIFAVKMLAIFIITLSIFVLDVAKNGNFHAITAGEAYRSAQLDKDQLAYYIKKYRIKSILNLRGKNASKSWYENELNFSAENNVMHYDVALSAYREPGQKDIREIMDIFQHAPRPLLIHCQAGADRSGLVAAMWKVVIDKKPKVEADKQLSILFGHLSIGSASAMDDFFQKWNPVKSETLQGQTL